MVPNGPMWAYIRDSPSSAPTGAIGGKLRGKEMPGLQMQPRRGYFMRLFCGSDGSQSLTARYRKVTTWPRVQVASGPKVVAVMPLVTSFSTAQATAFS